MCYWGSSQITWWEFLNSLFQSEGQISLCILSDWHIIGAILHSVFIIYANRNYFWIQKTCITSTFQSVWNLIIYVLWSTLKVSLYNIVVQQGTKIIMQFVWKYPAEFSLCSRRTGTKINVVCASLVITDTYNTEVNVIAVTHALEFRHDFLPTSERLELQIPHGNIYVTCLSWHSELFWLTSENIQKFVIKRN